VTRFYLYAVLPFAAAICADLGASTFNYVVAPTDQGWPFIYAAVAAAILVLAYVARLSARAGMALDRAVGRGIVAGAVTLMLAVLPLVAFLVYCFSPINPDAPCIR
jgi:hypothetical protein